MQKGIIGEDFNVLLYTLLCCFNSSMSIYYIYIFFLAETNGTWDVSSPTGIKSLPLALEALHCQGSPEHILLL